MTGGVGVSGVYWAAGRDSRYSGTGKGIWRHQGPLGGSSGCDRWCRGVRGVLGDGRDSRYSGT